ncbi:hypothetical protein HYALB_00010146 [Hymenoscyphus albidus]|uniref:P-loop containing nucleoside triphosphate hydrolase protein n=1 Tax=Hymenoscyphus albidus TaxID=595503 RepID=A0A9N9M1L0_9HELO|nr:hypothetical protein HYALB_00010146 [Hymenoscyphus albidus]
MAPLSEGSASPTSPNFASNSASARLLSEDSEQTVVAEEEEDFVAPPHKEEKKLLITAEHKIAFSHFLRIFSYSTLSDKFVLFAAAIASICSGVTLPLMNVVFGQLVGVFGEYYNPQLGETKAMFLAAINQNVLYMLYLFIARFVLDYIAILGFRMVSIRVSAAIRLVYLKALFAQPISTLDILPPGQTAAIITITASILQSGISEKLSIFIQSTTLVITTVIIAFHYSIILTLVTSIGLIFIVVFYVMTIPYLVETWKHVEHADRMSSSVASEAFSAIRMVVACGAEGKMAKKYSEWVKESRRRGILMSPLVAIQQAPGKCSSPAFGERLTNFCIVYFAINALFADLSSTFALSFWVAIRMYAGSMITSVTTMVIVLSSVMSITGSIGCISAPVTAAAQAAGAASIFFTIIDAPQPKTEGLQAPDVSSQEDIVLENVNFAYPIRADVKVLDNLNLRFPAGKQTAIVGASGSGKSTIVGLLERWYELNGNMTDNIITLHFRNGTIKAGGHNLHDIDLKWWRSQIGLVQQEPFLFNDTIYKNIEYGLIGTKWEHASRVKKRKLVKRACKEAFADEFIRRLPEAYNTLVGNAGIKLSGGQRQRLAIARSIVKQPKILILDEATSAIDVRGEKIVQKALDKVSKGRTTIVIAHRLSTIMKADKIVVLKKGQVVQEGTHAELMAQEGGAYWVLAGAQKVLGDTNLLDENGEGSGMGDLSEKGVMNEMNEKQVQVEEEDADIHALNARHSTELDEMDFKDLGKKRKGLLGSFELFLWEQKPQWMWYAFMMVGALGAGGKTLARDERPLKIVIPGTFPVHALLFAKLMSLFNLQGDYLISQSNFWCGMFTLLALGTGISYYILGWSSNTVSFNITATYRQEYFQNILQKPISYHDLPDKSIGSLTALVATDPTLLQQLLGLNMAIVCISIFNILGCIAISLYFGWKLTLVTILTAMPIILAAGFFRLRYETKAEEANQEVFKDSAKFATESIGAMRTVTALGLEGTICRRYERLLRGHAGDAWKKSRLSTAIFAISDSISLLCMAFVLWYGGQLLADFEYTPFSYLVVYLAVVQGSTSAGQSLSFGPNIAQAFAAAERIEKMRSHEDAGSIETPLEFGDTEDNEKGIRGVKIELKDVWFQYPTRDVPVLRGLNMTIEKGQFAAIVGPSGCGKTSIISLLERFYVPQKGEILFESRPLPTILIAPYRSHLSLVSQEPSLFTGTLRSNILLGVPSSPSSPTSNSFPYSSEPELTPLFDHNHAETLDETLEKAAKFASLHEFISSLPEGYDTQVGTNGLALSGGQKQRVSIARALARDPRVLLLDEATSNLDGETEREVQSMLEERGKGRTMVVVAHRLATVMRADVIFVVVDGRVVEKGSHQVLLGRRGVYWEMCQAQALDQ